MYVLRQLGSSRSRVLAKDEKPSNNATENLPYRSIETQESLGSANLDKEA